MTRQERTRWIWRSLIVLGVLLGARTLWHFPWHETGAALRDASLALLVAAALINFFSPAFKGAGWYFLLRGVARCRWWVAQEANLIGTAVNSVSIGGTGEAARIAVVTDRDGVPARAALLSVATTRIAEGVALACFIVFAPLKLDLPAQLRMVQIVAAILLVAVLAAGALPIWPRVLRFLPRGVRTIAAELNAIGGGRRLVLPVMCRLGSWVVEWMVYWAVLRATLGDVPWSVSFAALIVTNLGGVLRITPGNVGVLQATMVAALLPFGIPAERAVAAGLALQAVQVLPILALTGVVVQRAGLAWALSPRKTEDPTPA